jgi:hypothetical protein
VAVDGEPTAQQLAAVIAEETRILDIVDAAGRQPRLA